MQRAPRRRREPVRKPGPHRPPLLPSYEPEEPELEPAGGVPVGALPADGAPWVPEPLPILGQLRVEPEPELELDPLDPELEPEPELDEPVLVLPVPALPVLEPDDGVVVEEPEVEELDVVLVPEPVLPVLEVVAALATSAPPAKRPEVSAPTASTLRRRICMSCCPFHSCVDPVPLDRYRTRCARHLWRPAELPQRGGGIV